MIARDGEARREAGIRREGRPAAEVRWRCAIARQDRIERLKAEARNGAPTQTKGPAAAATEPPESPVR